MSESFPLARRWVQVASLLRSRGNKGEVLAKLLTDFPERLASLRELFVGKGDGEPQPRALQHFWVDRNHPNNGIFHFAGSTSIADAETLCGYDVFLPMEQRVTLPAGKYFVTDLIGCTVFELAENDVAPDVMMSLAGHMSEKMRQHYVHIRSEAKRRAVNSLSGTGLHRNSVSTVFPSVDTTLDTMDTK